MTRAVRKRWRMIAALSALLWTVVGAQACEEGACFYAGPRLASVDSQRSVLLDTLFSALLGSSVSLDVLDWNALATGEVDLASYLNALALEVGVSSAEEALLSDASLLDLIGAAGAVAQADGDTALVGALSALELPVTGLTGTVQLGDLLQLSFPEGGLSDVGLGVLDLLTGAVQLYNYDNVLTTPSPVTLSGSALSSLGLGGAFNSVELYLQVVEPPIYSCGGLGTTFHTAAIRTKLNVDLVDLSPDTAALTSALETALGVNTEVQVDVTLAQLQLYAELARAEGTLSALDIFTDALTIQATPGVVDLYLGEISDALFFNRTHLIDPLTDVTLGTIGTLDIRVDQTLPALTLADESTSILARGTGQGEAPFVSNLLFDPPYPQTQTASTSANFVNTLVSDLVTSLEVDVGGSLGALLDPLVNTVILPEVASLTETALSPVLETALTGLVDPLLELLGVRLGEVDVTVLGRGTSCLEGTVTHVIDVEPDGPTDFLLIATGEGVSNVLFDDDTDPTFANVLSFADLRSGEYSFEIAQVAGWMVESISCTEAGGGSVSRLSYGEAGPFFTGDRDVRIDLQANEQLTCAVRVVADTDGDYLPDSTDPHPNEIDPQGYIYDEVSGEIIPGGEISAVDSGGSPANVNIIQDGSSGEYQFVVTAADTYTVSVTPPPGYALSNVCDPQAGAYDATPTPDPNVIGSYADASGTQLEDASCSGNPYYFDFTLNEGDALVINNNYPLVPAASVSKSFSPAEIPEGGTSTLTVTIANTGANAVDLSNLSLSDALPAGVTLAATPNASTTCSGGALSAASGSGSVDLSGASLSVGSSCTVSADVTASAGFYTNLIPAGTLDNDQNVNADGDASATLRVEGDAPSGSQVCSAFSGSWSGSGNVWSSTTSGGVGITITLAADPGAAWQSTTNGAMNTINAWSEPSVQGATSFQSTFYWDTSAEGATDPASDDAAGGQISIAFDRPVLNPVLHIDRIGGLGGTSPNSSEWTVTTPSAYLTRLAGPTHFVTKTSSFYRDTNGTTANNAESTLDPTAGTAAGSLLFDGVFSSLDFDLTGVGVEGSGADGVELVLCAQAFDFGDLPAPYASSFADAGPTHQITGGVSTHYLGSAPDAETDAVTSSGTASDDSDDGVTLPPLLLGQSALITADVTGADGYLQAWIDWNGDGDFDDSGEKVASNVQDGSARDTDDSADGTITLAVTVPATATTGVSYARFRWSTMSGLGSTGYATDGEVEDYPVEVFALDYGDAPAGYGDALHGVNPSLALGALIDSESAAQLGADAGVGADGDDTDGSDDEDGVSFNAALYTVATSYSVPAGDITVTNGTGSPATLHAWLDFDRSGSFEADEYASAPVAAGATNPGSSLTWSGAGVSGMSAGISYARFRLSSDPDLSAATPSGAADDGEVEDHALLIQDPPTVCDGSSINEVAFENPVLQSGTALSVNAVYRFYDVVPGLDALVTVTGFGGGRAHNYRRRC